MGSHHVHVHGWSEKKKNNNNKNRVAFIEYERPGHTYR